ncbi:hypothetical protein BU24DRAFT_249007 [Aaosphaeria arxii CBS 175.79]|uniref:Uncharacterized protein n=1 Tax=Aaosphaeria arxii CBS 175.79 TaxID=1450172 RepID=A0A6A5XM98_9PLEO|nr:uncharacterized protein BU24DRAFT_249007 [Aaosphaeria arxii CBS 175.79]KAF2013870.1 hypothetical protein BU24DRAFT_249007 [Aaosphaeria arxii CBS 175.79]
MSCAGLHTECAICSFKTEAIRRGSWKPKPVKTSVIILNFKMPIVYHSKTYHAVKSVVGRISEEVDLMSDLSRFTVWSPCSFNRRAAVILTSEGHLWATPQSPIFEPLYKYLVLSPEIQTISLNYRAVSPLVSLSTDRQLSFDLITLQGPPSAAAKVGRCFGWGPKTTSLRSKINKRDKLRSSMSRELVQDFKAWGECVAGDPVPASCLATPRRDSCSFENPSKEDLSRSDGLHVVRSNEGEEYERSNEEKLFMFFRWNNRMKANMFKDHRMHRQVTNGRMREYNLWNHFIIEPVVDLARSGAKVQMFELELRCVEPKKRSFGTAVKEWYHGGPCNTLAHWNHRVRTLASGLKNRTKTLVKRRASSGKASTTGTITPVEANPPTAPPKEARLSKE